MLNLDGIFRLFNIKTYITMKQQYQNPKSQNETGRMRPDTNSLKGIIIVNA